MQPPPTVMAYPVFEVGLGPRDVPSYILFEDMLWRQHERSSQLVPQQRHVKITFKGETRNWTRTGSSVTFAN